MLPRALYLLIGLAVAGCRTETAVDVGGVPPTIRITGVTVRPLDRTSSGGLIHYTFADTLRGQLAFAVTTAAERVSPQGSAEAARSTGMDPFPGFIANPTVREKSSLTINRPILHRGVEIPANTNLLAVEAIRTSFDGSRMDLSFPSLSPFAGGETHFRESAFTFSPGDYEFTFRWETAEGEVFSQTVPVYLDLAGPQG